MSYWVMRSLCGEEELAEEVREFVAEEASRVFALVEEYGERVDGWIVAWGLVFDDRVEVIGANGGLRMTVRSVERAQRALTRRRKIRPVRTDHATAHRPEQITAITR
ncbi:MAG: hypothetical protein ACRDQ4_12870 [Pseudonocardiaceae bacterium]